MKKRYALHPGYVTSKTDGDRHYIGAAKLARLYELRPDEYIVWDHGYNPDAYTHLWPSYEGKYGRPTDA